MKIGIAIKFRNSPQFFKPFPQLYEECLEYARAADSLGFDYIIVPEHHSSEMGYDPTPFLALTAIARETKRIGLSTQPLLLPLHNPVEAAEQLAGLDVFSNGRARLGVGVGYRVTDFLSFGVPHRERGARMDEALTVLLGALRESGYRFEGKFYRVSDIDIMPKPIQQPHPEVYVTATSRKAADRAARFGLPMNTLFHHAIGGGLYDYYCERIVAWGHDPLAVNFSITRNGFIGPSTGAALLQSRPYLESQFVHQDRMRKGGLQDTADTPPGTPPNGDPAGRSDQILTTNATQATDFGVLVGGPDTWLETLEADLAALRGPVPISTYTFGLWPDGMALEDALATLDLFASHVRPWLASVSPAPRTP